VSRLALIVLALAAGIWVSSISGAAGTKTAGTPASTTTAGAAAASLVTRTFFARADATVEQAKPSAKFGSGLRLRVRGGTGARVKSLLRFRVGGVSGPVRSVQLWLRTGRDRSAATVNGPGIHATGNAWSEKTVSWSTRPQATSHPVDDKGAIGAATWVSYNVKPLVSGNGTYSFSLGTRALDNAAFHSREATTARPKLVVRFEAPERLVMAAGDIACDPSDSSFNGGQGTATECRQLHTSNAMLARGPHAVLPLGDLQYGDATLAQFNGSYHPSWGRLKTITRPAPGNHEYKTSGAVGYFDYFNGPGNLEGIAGHRAKGYYSYNLGAWHLVALNSECSEVGGCGPGSAQLQWLRQDLQSNARTCTLAYWHHPRFSSGNHGNQESTHGLWQALWQAGAEIVLSGHSHSYERFAPQNPSAVNDPGHGIRQFVVGTGGKDLKSFETIQPNSVVRNSASFGVLALRLRADSYRWQFVPAAGSSFTDSGSTACHGRPTVGP
jgi:acid phosphatase type 7